MNKKGDLVTQKFYGGRVRLRMVADKTATTIVNFAED